MVLLIEIGNSFISTACLFKNQYIRTSIPNYKNQINKEELIDLVNFYKKKKIKFSLVVICSVVPSLDEFIIQFFSKLKIQILYVNKLINKLNIKTNIVEKKKIGSDRLVNVFYTINKLSTPALIIDLGTATTFDYINDKNIYEGGIILPGIDISMNALSTNTAKLPKVKFNKTKELISNNTKGAISSGFYWGYYCMIEGLVEKIRKQKKIKIKTILTGGHSNLFSKNRFIDLIDRDLTMKGLYLIYERFG